tara:strand:- start:22336 stop:22788 length:453 start_codon:yes stop_codon:yes gene_type:complete
MFIHHDAKKIEDKCEYVYLVDGAKIANKLMQVVMNPKHRNAIGLAHNQIGGNKKVFVAKIDKQWRVFINPSIVKKSDDVVDSREGCMTFPNMTNVVKRHTWIEVESQVKERNDIKGQMFKTERFEGMNAIVIQHEIDHLNGIHIFNKEEE